MQNGTLIWLSLTALLAGAVNSIAGGGTLLTFPALLAVLVRVDPATAAVFANATSTVALVPGSLAGAWGYRHKIHQARRWLALLLLPSLVGGAIGSLLVTRLDPRYFAALVPWLIFGATALLLIDSLLPRKGVSADQRGAHSLRSTLQLIAFQFCVAIYGGYFGAGIGILMLSSLAMMGIGDINRMNALKTVLAACINGTSVAIFVMEDAVYWQYALPMALMAIVGGYLGARAALLIRPRQVRWIVIAIGFSLSAYYFAQQIRG